MEYLWIPLAALGALLVIFLSVILIRTLRFKPVAQQKPLDGEEKVEKDTVVENLRTLVRYKTVSYRDSSLEDDEEFEGMINKLPELYPNVYEKCTLTRLPDRALLYHWKGKNDGECSVMMAHYDVVPVNADAWEKPPFEAILENDVIWGRGTLDTKVTFASILYAANKLIGDGFVPENDVYFAFSGGEEINGNGASNIVDYFEKNNISPALVLDEGGAVVEGVFPGVSAPCGLIGIAEKGMMDLCYTTKSAGGHASAPKPHTPVGVLSAACVKVEGHPFKSHLSAPVAKMFDTLGRHSSFVYRMIFANLWCFSPVLDMICKKSGGELNALMRTTVAFTQMSGSAAANVIPPEASMVSNMRLNPHDTVESALEYIKKTIDDDSIELSIINGMNPSRISVTEHESYEKVALAITSTWKGTIVSPYLMVQCSDSRNWGRISDKVYRFSAMDLTSEERATIHGNNERIRVDALMRASEFYLRLIRMC